MSPHCPQHALPAPAYQHKGLSTLIISCGILIVGYACVALRYFDKHATYLLFVSVKQLLPSLHHLADKNWYKTQ